MSNRDSMEEWQLQSTLETLELLSIPRMKEKLLKGQNTPLSECIPESEIDW